MVLLYGQDKKYFLVLEILTVLSIFFFLYLYQKFLKPVSSISSAAFLLKEKDFNTSLNKTGQKDLDGLVEVYNQMASKLREERIQHEEKNYFLEMIIQASPSAILIFSLDEHIIQVNPAACNMLGIIDHNEILGKKLKEINSPLFTQLESLETGIPQLVSIDGINRYKAQKAVFIDKGFQRYFIILEELTGELLDAERQSYGKVIRFMSHEVNNTVAAVNSILTTVKDSSDNLDEDYRKALDVSVERNRNLSRFMENYASVVKIGAPNKESFELKPVVEACIHLLKPDMDRLSVSVSFIDNEAICCMEADKGLMEQVFINILKNSMEAIQHNGEISINLTSTQIVFSDNGCGIKPDDKEQIFSPFYTNKPNGQGIGLTFIREVLLVHDFGFTLGTSTISGLTEFKIDF